MYKFNPLFKTPKLHTPGGEVGLGWPGDILKQDKTRVFVFVVAQGS